MKQTQLLLICISLSIVSSTNCPLRDEFNSANTIDEWKTCNWINSFTSTNSELIYDCDGQLQFGSYGQFGEDAWARTSISNIPSHDWLNIKLTFWAMDSWDSEYVYIYLDGNLVYTQNYQWSYSDQKICGDSYWGEREDYIDITVDHTATVADFYITTGLNQDSEDESWAISDWKIEYVNADDAECADIDTTQCIQNEDLGYPCKLRCDFDQLSAATDGWDDSQWTATAYERTVCDQFQMFGGYSVFGSDAEASTAIFDIPAHEYLHVTFTGYFIDSWDDESFFVNLDGNTIVETTFQYSSGENICGSGTWNEQYESFDLYIAHSSDSASFIFTSSLNQGATDESWGISDFVVEYFSADYDSCASEVSCPSEEDFGNNECLITCSLGQGEEVTAFVDQDLSDWTFSGTSNDYVFTECDGMNMIGGYGVFGSGATAEITFDDIPTHEVLSIKFRLYIGDSWDKEFFNLYVDDVLVKNENFAYSEGTDNTCGSGWNDQYFDIHLDVGHVSDSANFVFAATINQGATDESWGFSDFVVTYFTNRECSDAGSVDICHLNPTECSKVTVYEFCDFTGRAAEVDDVLDCIAFTPQAICVPDGIMATIHDLCWYEGDTTDFYETTSCMTGSISTDLLQSNGNLKKKNNAKDSKKDDKVAQVTVNY